MSRPLDFLDTIQTRAGLETYVNKLYDIYDQIEWMPLDIIEGRLAVDELVIPVYAVKYTVAADGKFTALSFLEQQKSGFWI